MRRIFTLSILGFLLGFNPTITLGALTNSIVSGNWSSSSTWDNGVPSNNKDAVIKTGFTVILDVDVSNPGTSILVEDGATLTSSGANNGILIKTNGYFEVYGTLSIYSVDVKNGVSPNYIYSTGDVTVSFLFDHNTASGTLTVDGSLTVDPGTLKNAGIINGTGSIYAAIWENTGTVFGISGIIADGSTIGGATWDGSEDETWHTAANWANGVVPDKTYNIVVTGDGTAPIISGSHTAKAITINSGSVLTLAVGSSITVTEDITNNTGNSGLVIQSSASGSGSLISESGTPPATVESYISQGAWHQVACPTDAGNTSNFYDVSNDSWFLKHTESTDEWTYITNIDSTISRNQGFNYWVTTSKTLTFTGNLTKVDQNPVLAYSGSNSDQGWNLLGNPFTSALNWDNPGWGNNTTGSVYVYDATYNGGDYRSWNGSTGDLADGTIPMGQGFFVIATSAGSFTIPKAARFHSNQPFYKSQSNNNSTQYVRIQLDGENIGNTVFIGFPENGTEGFDNRGDADKLYSSNDTPQLFAVENNTELCINANAPLTEGESKTVPLHLVQIIDGEYSISISKLDQLENISISLEDSKTNKIQDLRETPVYSFTASSNDEAQRFLLHFAWSPNGIEDIDKDLNIQIYSFGKHVYIRSTDEAINQNGDVFIYDLMGRELAQKKIMGTELTKIPVNTTDNYLVVKVVKGGLTKTQKVYIK